MSDNVVLLSGYGAAGEEDIVLYRISECGAKRISGIMHGRSPSFCCCGENGLIYVASEREDGADITSYVLNGNELHLEHTLEVPGNGLCHVYACGGIVFGCCYGSGHYFAVDAALTNVLWQFKPDNAHAHWSNVIGGKLYLMDLGNDCIYRFELLNGIPFGSAEILRQPKDSGPRQILTAKDSCLCINELDGTVRELDRNGMVLSEVRATSMQDRQNWPGGAVLGADGTLYVCNRGPNTISEWSLHDSGLRFVREWSTGNWPRHIAYLPSSDIILAACQRDNDVRGYAVHGGMTHEIFSIHLSGASCVLVLR